MGSAQIPEIEFAQIEPTTRCNFTCGFCCGRRMEQRSISPRIFAQAIERLPRLKHIELQGEGEPLLHPQFFEMAGLAHDRGIKVSTITNGSLFTMRDTIKKLIEVGLEKISVSIESADPAQFKRIRGGRLDTVIAGISALLAERNARGLTRPLLDFAVTVLESTVASYPAIVDLYQRLGMDGGINTQLLQRMGTYTAHYSPELQAELVSAESAERFQALRAAGERRIGAPPKIGFYKEFFADRPADLNICPWLERGTYISADGRMTPCCKIKDTAKLSYGEVADPASAGYYRTTAAMRADLHRGVIPPECTGCSGAEPFRGRPDRLACASHPGRV